MVGPPTVCLPALQCKTSKANLNVFYSREVSAIQDNRRKDSVQILLWHSSLSSVQRQVRNSHTLLQCLNMPTYALLGTTGATARSINISWGSFPGSSISACTMLALILRAPANSLYPLPMRRIYWTTFRRPAGHSRRAWDRMHGL